MFVTKREVVVTAIFVVFAAVKKLSVDDCQ
jgi:hypothetical protein